jgi:hypothetical protein
MESMSGNGDEVREREMARLRREIQDRSMRGESHHQIVHWLATQESSVTECELALAKVLASHHARRAGSGVAMYLEDVRKTFD